MMLMLICDMLAVAPTAIVNETISPLTPTLKKKYAKVI